MCNVGKQFKVELPGTSGGLQKQVKPTHQLTQDPSHVTSGHDFTHTNFNLLSLLLFPTPWAFQALGGHIWLQKEACSFSPSLSSDVINWHILLSKWSLTLLWGSISWPVLPFIILEEGYDENWDKKNKDVCRSKRKHSQSHAFARSSIYIESGWASPGRVSCVPLSHCSSPAHRASALPKKATVLKQATPPVAAMISLSLV